MEATSFIDLLELDWTDDIISLSRSLSPLVVSLQQVLSCLPGVVQRGRIAPPIRGSVMSVLLNVLAVPFGIANISFIKSSAIFQTNIEDQQGNLY